MTYARASDISRDLAELIRPPRRVPVSDSARRYVKVYDGETWDFWQPDATPYMLEPMDTLASRQHEAVVFCGPSRSGKTAALIDCWIGHASVSDPGDMAFYFPDQESSEDYGKANTMRMFQESEALRQRLSPRAHDNNITTTKLRNGMLIRLLYPTSAKLSRITLKSVGLTEYDSIKDNIASEGAAFLLAKKRVQNAMSAGMAMAESSPKRAQIDPGWVPKTPHEAPPTAGGILPLYNQGDRRRWYWACLHCGGRFEAPALPHHDDLPDIEAAAQTACVPCPHCGATHRAEDRRALNLGGRWLPEWFVIGADPADQLRHVPNAFIHRGKIASFWLLGSAAAFQPWPALVANYLRALREFEKTGGEENLKTTLNTDQGLPYLPAALRGNRSAADLVARAEFFERAVVPEGARFLVATVDTQKRRFDVQINAIGVGAELWIIDRYNLTLSERIGVSGDPEGLDPATYDEDWRLLVSKVLAATYPLADSSERAMPVRFLGVDSGGEEGVSERAYAFWRWCKKQGLGQRVLLLKGDKRATDHSPVVDLRFPDLSARKGHSSLRGDVPLYFVNGVRLGDTLYADLDKTDGPGAIHYAEWLGEDTIEQLASEVRRNGRWEKASKAARNETPDLLRYARAILHVAQCNMRGNKLALTGWGDGWELAPPWAGPWDKNPVLGSVAEKTAERPSQGPARRVASSNYLKGRR